jgi:6-phosphogluconolactonase (cycloisomerase 2 family)
VLLTQILLSNQKKLRNLEDLQKMEKLNKEYEKKVWNAKMKVEKWQQFNKNNKIIKELLNVLNF